MKSFKAAIGIGIRRASQRKQMGVATVLVILMVGVGVVAVSVGAMHTMRNTQERQLVAHAQVNAQAGAWAAVEAVRQVLGGLTADQLASLVKDKAWNITGTDGFTQSAIVRKVVAPVPPLEDYKITAEVSAIADAGQSSSTIEVIYSVKPGSSPSNFTLNGVLDFYNDLNIGGGITLNVPNKANFNVDGNFSATSIGIGGIGLGRVAVTGDVKIDSAVSADEIWGRNVEFQGGSNIGKVFAFGDPDGTGKGKPIASLVKADTCCGYVEMTGGTGAGSIQANGTVDLAGGGAGSVMALRDVNVAQGGGTYRDITSGGRISITNANGSAFDSLGAVGNIALGQISVSGLVKSQADVTCHADVHFTINAGGAVNGCQGASIISNMTPKPSITLLPPVEKVALRRPVVDAWSLRSAANYVIEFEAGTVKITVRNINGMEDGDYYLARGHGGWDGNQVISREHLCKKLTLDSNKKPIIADQQSKENVCLLADKAKNKPFCSKDEYNECFTVDPDKKFIKMTGSMPPGVVWIDGDLELAGTFFNTFIVTGNITTSGSISSYALNYAAAYDKSSPPSNAVCKNQFGDAGSNDFLGMYPTNYCNSTGVFTPNALGNIGLLAGGYNPTDNPTKRFSGGGIRLGNGNNVYGTVIAGDILETGGNTNIYGYISGAGLLLDPTTAHKLGNSTKIDLLDLPDGYDPQIIPDMGGGGGGGGTPESRVLWTRYL